MVRKPVLILAVLAAVLVTSGVAGGPAAGAESNEELSFAVGWRQVSAGGTHTCAITTERRLYCWGSDAAGQLGDGGDNADRSVPTEVAGGRTDWAKVSTGEFFTCARTTGGQLFCWGSDFYGQLGNGGDNTDVGEPTEVAGGRRFWADVSAGTHHACARSRAGRLFCFGRDGSGQLGNDADFVNQNRPVEVAGGATDWRKVSAGMFHTCALTTTNRLFCFGTDGAGQLGNGAPFTDSGTPVEVASSTTNWVQVATGASHTCALKALGRLYCWGWDRDGQRGDGDPATDDLEPAPVRVAEGSTRWAGVTASGWHTCARTNATSGGTLSCWGLDSNGEVGDGEPFANQPAPAALAGRRWRQVDAGDVHTCAIKVNGRLFCWGDGGNGRIGIGDDAIGVDQPAPVRVPLPT
ncbi:MAG: hypothetical protein KDB35_22525 [Acidimicrobiales bacterium]|nr:hypothetical protein [Acidimicrobiales bacterium]MCB9371822.1 hypothetical protein [Microthrixaceae bacterium]